MSSKITAVPGQSTGGAATKSLAKPAKGDELPGDPAIEVESEEEALELANQRNRAVFCRSGWVCPSVIRERH